VDLVLAEPVEGEHVGEIAERDGQVRNEVADEGESEAPAAARGKCLLEGVRLARAGASYDELLVRRRVDDRRRRLAATSRLLLQPWPLSSHPRGCNR
jgi:hypothetical protein